MGTLPRQPTAELREAWSGRIAFELHDRRFSFLDVLQAAELRGDLEPLVAASQQAANAEALANSQGRNPDPRELEVRIDAFRYHRNLLTVEETEAWLAARGLDVDDLAGHFLRRYWVESPGLCRGEQPAPNANAPAPVPPEIWSADLHFTGAFPRLARQLAREAAIGIPDAGTPASPGGNAGHPPELGPAEGHAWRQAWGLDEMRMAEFGAWQGRFRARRQAIATPERRAALLAAQRSNLVHVEIEALEFDTEDAAREAYLCVTADGVTFEALAAQTGYPLLRRKGFLHELPEAWRLPVLGAAPGRVIEPLAAGGAFHLCRMVRESEPLLSQAALVAELDNQLLQRHCAELDGLEIRWHIAPEEPE